MSKTSTPLPVPIYKLAWVRGFGVNFWSAMQTFIDNLENKFAIFIDIATELPYVCMVSRKTNQTDFFQIDKSKLNSRFGASCLRSNPKSSRPISTKDLMHVVLKSSLARGPYSFLHFERIILKLLRKLALNMNVTLNDVVIMSNHIHLSIKVKSRRAFSNYLRAASGLIARKVLGVEKHRPSTMGKFFMGRPFSRIVASGKKSWKALAQYFELNRLEKCGFSKAESRAWNLHLLELPDY